MLSSVASRLLAEVEASHRALAERAGADRAVQQGLGAVYEAIAAALDGLDEECVLASPSPEEWSMAEVVEHVAEHDRKYVELEQRGAAHYVEHGLEHALQLWKLRLDGPPSTEPGQGE